MTHDPLVSAAHSLLLENLTRYGNQIGPDHSAALKALCQDMTDLASGNLTGRWAWGLGTGLGKSASVVAWITALYRMGKPYEKVSVAVSASTVEALCELQRDLITSGVPADEVGLVHSYIHSPAQAALGTPGYASEPSTGHCLATIRLAR